MAIMIHPKYIGYGERTDEEMCYAFTLISIGHETIVFFDYQSSKGLRIDFISSMCNKKRSQNKSTIKAMILKEEPKGQQKIV